MNNLYDIFAAEGVLFFIGMRVMLALNPRSNPNFRIQRYRIALQSTVGVTILPAWLMRSQSVLWETHDSTEIPFRLKNKNRFCKQLSIVRQRLKTGKFGA